MIGARSIGALPLGAINDTSPPVPPPVPLARNTLPAERRIVLAEITAAGTAPIVTTPRRPRPLGASALGAGVLGGSTPPAPQARDITTMRASDVGYRSAASDAGGVQSYPPTMVEGLAVDRELPLTPTGTAAGAAWGRLRLLNMDRALTARARAMSPAGRPVRVRWGYKGRDAARDIETDPALSHFATLFEGVGIGWTMGETTLEVAVRDASWWAERPLQATLYGGTGGLEGPASLAGQPVPKLRGGTPSAPVRDCEPVLVDPVRLIYQFSDARAVITTLYERGAPTITFQGDVADLTVGSTNPGEYRTDSARALFQLGSDPVGRITVDAYGATPVSDNFEANPALLALAMLYEDIGLDPAYVEPNSFLALASSWAFPAGWYWREPVAQGLDAVALLLASINAALLPLRDGRLAAVPLRLNGTPVARYTDAEIITLTPVELPASVNPPPWRWRVGHTRCHTPQSSDLAGAITPERTQFLAAADRIAGWVSADILAAYPRRNDPAVVTSAHLASPGAQQLADALGGIWGGTRELHDLVLPLGFAARHEIGETLLIVSSAPGFEGGRNVAIVGERLRTSEINATLRVLA